MGLGISPVDELGISPEMLAKAARKGIYRKLLVTDLTTDLPVASGFYSGLVSSGTFTIGHVGPEVLP